MQKEPGGPFYRSIDGRNLTKMTLFLRCFVGGVYSSSDSSHSSSVEWRNRQRRGSGAFFRRRRPLEVENLESSTASSSSKPTEQMAGEDRGVRERTESWRGMIEMRSDTFDLCWAFNFFFIR